ncbi:MAG: glycosyltransferase family 4 protein [Paludibacteraceae bacterium]
MNIVYDNIIFDLQRSGGISVYWSEIISRISSDGAFNPIFIEKKQSKSNYSREKISLPSRSIINENNLLINRILPIKERLKEEYLFHSSYYRFPIQRKNNAIVTTIHDFIPERFGKGIKKVLLTKQKYLSIKNADGIICVSENTKKDMLALYPEFRNKTIDVIHNGASTDFSPLVGNTEDEILRNLPNPFCIFIGKRNKYKNFDFVVNYLAEEKELHLAIVGGGNLSVYEKELLDTKLNNRFSYFNHISNTDLNVLYNQAEFLFYPSDYEGFGIPIIEAQKSGCPFVAQKTSSINELVSDKNLLLNKLSNEDVNIVRQYIQNKRSVIIEKGIKDSEKFSWERSAENHVLFYNKIFKQKFGNK